MLGLAAAFLFSMAAGQAPRRNTGEQITVDVDLQGQVMQTCAGCHLDMHGKPVEAAGKGRKVGQCTSCHQALHRRPVRVRLFDARITFRRAVGDFEAGKAYEGQLAMKNASIFLYPERHMHIGPGRATGLKFVKEEGGYVFFTVFLSRGLRLNDVEVSFVPWQFRAGEKKATVGAADIAQVWFKIGGRYLSLDDYRKTYSKVDSGPAGGGVKPLAFTDYDVPARFPGAAGRRRPGQAPPAGRTKPQPLGRVVFTYNLKKVRPYHFVNRPDGVLVGAGSNQIALWIEDEDGHYVDTVFVTRLAGRKGYRFNPETLPMWRAASRWDLVPREEADAVSGPTQRPGVRTLVWDCRDWRNQPVRPGRYTYRLEANLMMANRAVWSGQIEVGSRKQSSTPTLRRIPAGNTVRLIVTDVKATYTPAAATAVERGQLIEGRRPPAGGYREALAEAR